MRYLIKRDDFLRNVKGVEIKSDFLMDMKVNEASGPFENSVGWNDSLLGRLINHMIRKAQVAIGRVRIKPVIERLKSEFDRILAEGLIEGAGDDLKESIVRVTISKLFQAISDAIEKEEVVRVIKDLVDTAIDYLKKNKIDKSDILLDELEEFKKFLEQFKDEEIPEEDEDEEDEDTSYPKQIANLKSVYNILKIYGQLLSIKKDNRPEPKKPSNQEPSALKAKEPTGVVNKPVAKTESYIFESNGESTAILNSIKELWNYCKTASPDILKDFDMFFKMSVENQSKDQFKNNIAKIYSNISKVNEDFNQFLTRPEKIAEKIGKLYASTKGKTMANIDFGMDEALSKSLKIELDNFNKTMSEIIKSFKDKKEVIKKEGFSLMSYDMFLKINEAEENENKERSASDPKDGSVYEKIKEFYDKNCKTVKEYTLDETEVEKIKNNIEELSKKGDDFVITGLDPIIEIVRLFNRAYKIYTVATITKRSNGKVDPSTFGEYTSYGGKSSGGELNGWAGPYRNNKIFNSWEDAVLKIMGDRKYQFIFNPNTKIKMPLVPNPDPKNKKNWEYREKGGVNLRAFMTDIMDGEELYKMNSNEKGAQSKFLEKYFGSINSEIPPTSIGKDGEENLKLQKEINDKAKKISFSRGFQNKEIKAGQFFVLEGKNESDKITTRYFFVTKVTPNRVYLAYCNSFYYFESYISDCPNQDPKDQSKKKVEKGELAEFLKNSKVKIDGNEMQVIMKYTYSKGLENILKPGKINIKGLDGEGKIKDEEFTVDKFYWLTEEQSGIGKGTWTGNYTEDNGRKFINKKINSFGPNNKVIFEKIPGMIENKINDIGITKV